MGDVPDTLRDLSQRVTTLERAVCALDDRVTELEWACFAQDREIDTLRARLSHALGDDDARPARQRPSRPH
jgi:uncharacterized coiled-coil protein SlyX